MATPNTDAAQTSAKYEYKTNPKTFETLEKLPWDKLEDQLGLRKDMFYVKKGDAFESKWKMDGVLEGLAYGRFTAYPVPVIIKAGDLKPIHTYATLQVSFNKQKDGYEFDIHPVNGFKYKLDQNGEPVVQLNRETGMPEFATEFDRNPIKENDSISLFGKQLNKVEVENLRQTGNLGSVFVTPSGKQLLVSVDPYNNHSLCYTSVDFAKKILENAKFTYKGEAHEFTQSEIASLLNGRSVKITGPENKVVNVQFNANKGKVVIAPFFKNAFRQEQTQKEAENRKQAQTQSQAPVLSNGVGFGDFH